MERNMKSKSTFNKTLLLFILAVLLIAVQLQAQTYVQIVNPSFELPGIEKVKGWDSTCSNPSWTALYDIPGWRSDGSAYDSGVESGQGATDGTWTGFLMAQDTSVYQITNHIIVDGDDIELLVDAKNTWQATTLEIGFFYVDTTGAKFYTNSGKVTVTSNMATYSVKFKSSDHPEALGNLLGIWIDNVTPTPESWIGLDNVRAINSNPSIEVINFSFEQPGVGKIKGWDSNCSDPGWTGATDDIPGWNSAEPVWDCGVETGYTPTDGEYTAFLMGGDTSTYQITNHLIQGSDDIELFVDARITWAATIMEMKLFYVDTLGSFNDLEINIVDLISDMSEYSVAFKASNYPASVGNKLGIWFDNVSDSASWLGLDNVRLINSGATDVKTTKLNPTVYSLLQNYPNPFNPQTTIKYSLPLAGLVTLKIYDLLGREVTTLIQGKKETAGNHSINFNANNLPSGIYFYRLQADKFSETKKMILIK
jgi:hypothetical protein